MQRKLCRAAACPRKVGNHELFCNVHFRQLTPKLLSPIATNTEAPRNAPPEAFRAVREGTTNAVRFLAKKEGRATALKVAEQTQSFDPGQGGTGDANSTAEAAGLGPNRFTDRYNLQ